MQELRAGAMEGVHRLVADDPLVVDRIVVAQGDRHRDAHGDDNVLGDEPGVPDRDLDRGRWPAAREGAGGEREHDHEGDEARPDPEAGLRAGHAPQPCGVRRLPRDRGATTTTTSRTARAITAARTIRVQVMLSISITIGAGASNPAWTHDGTPWPLASMARS